MKLKNKWLIGAVIGVGVSIASTSCVDDIKFGDSFLEKAPGGSVTKDTVFNNAEYTRQFLTAIYSKQYYGLPYGTKDELPDCNSAWVGKFDALTDCWQIHWDATSIVKYYYTGTLNAATAGSAVFTFTGEKVWEAVRAGWLLLENIENVPGLDDNEKKRMVAETKCIMAARYFDLFRFFGGLPLVTSSFTGTDSSYELPRATVEETVNFIIKFLDEAAPNLPWSYEGADAVTNTGRWTQAGAMGLKCQVLQFAASPLFNDAQGYAGGSSEAETKHLVWYGGYKPELWQQCKKACEEFFNALASKGFYKLNSVIGANTPENYRQAYRMGYALLSSPEILHSVRVMGTDAFKSGTYSWHQWCDNGRNSYTPTQEYVEMFPWSDGTPFDWNKAEAEGKLDEMFLKGSFKGDDQSLSDLVLTRDPRLYENVRVNGQPKVLDWTTAKMSGDPYELWVGGTTAKQNSKTESGNYATGYDNMKYYIGTEYQRKDTQWVYLRLSDVILIYAEALLQADNNFSKAIEQVNIVRARVGLKGLVECNPDKNLLGDKDQLLNEILRERVCEMGMENARYFDMVRYKMKDRFELPLHGLLIYRLDENGNRIETAWTDGDKKKGAKQPTHFDYEKFTLSRPIRAWWGNNGFDPKWYLAPFPQTEINKGYGLVQNPGW